MSIARQGSELAAAAALDSIKTVARSEGWTVSTCPRGAPRLSALSNMAGLADDRDVWTLVIRKAVSGSETHIKALKAISAANPTHFSEIASWARILGFWLDYALADGAATTRWHGMYGGESSGDLPA